MNYWRQEGVYYKKVPEMNWLICNGYVICYAHFRRIFFTQQVREKLRLEDAEIKFVVIIFEREGERELFTMDSNGVESKVHQMIAQSFKTKS